MDKQVIIECVWYDSKRDFNKFIRKIENDNVVIIDYLLIKNKLIKADPYTQEPHKSIIGLNIINMIKDCFNGKKDPDIIVYSIKNMNLDTVANFKSLIQRNSNRPYTIGLNILNMSHVPSKEILNKFDYIKVIDND